MQSMLKCRHDAHNHCCYSHRFHAVWNVVSGKNLDYTTVKYCESSLSDAVWMYYLIDLQWELTSGPPPLYETCPIIYCKQEMWSDCRVKGVGSKGQIPQPLVCLADQTQRASMNAHTHVQEHTDVYECNRLDELIEPASPKGQQQHFLIFFIPEFGDFLPCSLVIVYIFQHCSH